MNAPRHGYAAGKMHPLYRVWASMRSRCNCPSDTGYAAYGAKGIRVCNRWDKFENFLADMGPRPSPKHTLDRIESRGHYEPGNCRWATYSEQNMNRSNTVRIPHDGETLTVPEWAKRFGITPRTIYRRRHEGKVGAELFAPVHSHTRT